MDKLLELEEQVDKAGNYLVNKLAEDALTDTELRKIKIYYEAMDGYRLIENINNPKERIRWLYTIEPMPEGYKRAKCSEYLDDLARRNKEKFDIQEALLINKLTKDDNYDFYS